MNLSKSIRVPSAVHARLSVAGHPELDRVIEAPAGGSSSCVVDAYLLSIGVRRDATYGDDERYFEMRPSSWRYRDSQSLRIPGVPHVVDVEIVDADAPAVGQPRVAVVAGEPIESLPMATVWQTDPPPFRLDHVNLELLRRYGVVLPYFDDGGLAKLEPRVRAGSHIASLLRALEPVRRLALRAHLDDVGILRDASQDAGSPDVATASLRMLVHHVGVVGLAQDPTTGWVAESDAEAVVDQLDWSSASAEGVGEPRDVLFAFARRTKILRRLKGRVVVSKLGRDLVEPGRRSSRRLAVLLAEPDRPRYSWGYQYSPVIPLALLSIADGSAATFADVAGQVALGRAGIDRNPYRHYDEIDMWSLGPEISESSESVAERVQALVDDFAALSEVGSFGVITPAMRALAREALL
ncbi:MAG TPA: hypothetical protein VN035_06785 [Microbacterium sp.]|nr:hypothetical protein [Microbacterium sp.]